MIILLVISLLFPLSTGYFFTGYFWPEVGADRDHFLIRCFLGVGLGMGITSSIFFVWLLVFGSSIGGLIVVEIALLASLIYFYKINRTTEKINRRPLSKQPIPRILKIGFYLVLFSAIASFIIISLREPHGRWDAWVVWNLRARFMFRGAEHWKDMFSRHLIWSHPDYPLLISATVARCWKVIGRDTLAIPVLVSMLFTFATAGLLFSALSIVKDKTQGLLAATVLLATPFFIEHGATQYADLPLGFFFLATLVLFSLHQRIAEDSGNLLFLAGVATGMAIWTKNEGFLFLVVIIIARIAAVVPAKGIKTYFKQLLPFTIGILPLVAITLYLKTQLAPPSELFTFQGFKSAIDQLTDLSRLRLIRYSFKDRIIHSGGWVTNITFLLFFYILFLGINIEKDQKRALITSLVTLSLMLAGYLLVFIITSHDLDWCLKHTLGRLLLQLYPSSIFAFFLMAGSHEKVNDFVVKDR